MNYYYGWGFFIWPVLFFFLIFGLFAWWPSRWYGRYRSYDPDEDQAYPYGWRRRGFQRGKGPKNYRRSDERIAEDVNDRLLINDEVDASGILVSVKDGLVTLSGQVSSRTEKRQAEWLADFVPGVVDVKNELVISSVAKPGNNAA
jgi:hypothetical protein